MSTARERRGSPAAAGLLHCACAPTTPNEVRWSMSSLPRSILFLACCGALAAGACWAAARTLDALPLDSLADGLVQAQRYDCATAAAQARLRLKLELADGLAEGRLWLVEAIAAFRRPLDDERPAEAFEAGEYGWANVGRVGGETDEERCGRNLIWLVRGQLTDSPSVAEAAAARLEKELQEHLAGKGPRPARP